MSQPDITIYATGWCGFCQRAKALLTRKNLAFHEIDVESDPKWREEMIARSGRRTVPQIFIGGRHIGGCDDLLALDADGGLDRAVASTSSRGADERG